MDNTQHSSREVATKILAITGFFASLAFVLWLLVQGIRMIPDSFFSLANIFKSVSEHNPYPTLTIGLEKSIVNSGESFKISWTDLEKDGSYIFSYSCTPDASIAIRSAADSETVIPCNEELSLPHDVHGLFLTVTTKERQFVDVPFSIAYADVTGVTKITQNAEVTVVNTTVPSEVAVKPTEPKTTPKPVPPKPPVSQTPAPRTPPTPAVTSYTFIPVSLPNGFTDLKTTILGIGELSNSGAFTAVAAYDMSDTNALRFEVKNIGTKTSSDNWTFTVTLPDGETFTSEKQDPLKPNERAIFTYGFDLDTDMKAGTEDIKVSVHEENDRDTKNNSSSWVVKVTK